MKTNTGRFAILKLYDGLLTQPSKTCKACKRNLILGEPIATTLEVDMRSWIGNDTVEGHYHLFCVPKGFIKVDSYDVINAIKERM